MLKSNAHYEGNVMKELFESKMAFVQERTGTHPKMKFLMMVGPEDADTIYNIMFSVFCSGYHEGTKSKT